MHKRTNKICFRCVQKTFLELTLIKNKILEIRGYKLMLDYDLAELYEVETKVLNQAVKRNIKRFQMILCFN